MFKTLFCLLALLAPTAAWAQAEADPNANPVSVRLEIFIVSKVGGNETFQEAATARPGQVVEYRLFANNEGDTTLPPGTVVVSGPVPDGTTYVANSATPTSDAVLTEFSVDGETFGDGDAPLFKNRRRRAPARRAERLHGGALDPAHPARAGHGGPVYLPGHGERRLTRV